MTKRRTRFGESCLVYKDVMVGQIEIHPGDTVSQKYGSSTTLELYPGAKLNAVYCTHK